MSNPPPSPNDPASIQEAQFWNQRFAADDFVFGTLPNAWLKDHAGAISPKGRVLCVADGEGRNSVWLAQQGFAVDAFDISELGVAKAKKLAQSRNVSVDFCVADCESYRWQPGHYDGIAAIFVQFAEPGLRVKMFANLMRCLKPGGVLILQGYTPKQLDYKTGGPPHLSHLYTETLVREAFGELEILVLQTYEAELSEGSGHLGRSALIGMVARRRR